MKYRQLVVEQKEYAILSRQLAQPGQKEDSIYSASVKKLKNELSTAQIVAEADMPTQVVRFNSIVTISSRGNKDKSFQLVLPEKSNIAESRLSVLAPMGLALFGYAQGDQISWEFPSGVTKIKIIKVEQPV